MGGEYGLSVEQAAGSGWQGAVHPDALVDVDGPHELTVSSLKYVSKPLLISVSETGVGLAAGIG